MTANYHNIGVHVEITANCNSRCLDCSRFVKGTDTVNPYVETGRAGNMSMSAFQNVFDDEILKNARYVNFTGTYGEATMHPEFFDMLRWLIMAVETRRDDRTALGLDPRLVLMIETNGGLHDAAYWAEFADIVKSGYHKYSRMIFGLDGTDDATHQLYRRGVDFDQCLENADAAIRRGVRVEWSMIEFAHNEHQLEQAREMADRLGFWRFRVRRSRLRSVIDNRAPVLYNEYQKKKNISDQSVQVSSKQASMFEQSAPAKPGRYYWQKPVPDYINETKVSCEWADKQQISVDYTGRVWQCCYFSTFYHNPVEHSQVDAARKTDFSAEARRYENLSYYEDQYQEGWNNINLHSLSDILQHRFFKRDLPGSLDSTTDEPTVPRIFRCGKHCGQKARDIETKLNAS